MSKRADFFEVKKAKDFVDFYLFTKTNYLVEKVLTQSIFN